MSGFSPSARNRTLSLAACAVASALLASQAQAQAQAQAQTQAAECKLTISQAPQAVRLEYDPFLPATAPAPLGFRVRNAGAQACQAELALVDVPGQALVQQRIGTTDLKVEIRPNTAVTRSTTPSVFRVEVPPDQTLEVTFDVVVIEDAVVQAGDYAQTLTLELRQPGGSVAYDRSPVVIDVAALPRAQMNLAGARGAFGTGPSVSVVDFGEAETGKTHQMFIQTRTNSAARLTFTSANRGLLVQQGTEGEAATLPYAVAFDGGTLDLGQVATRDVDPPRTYAGQSYDLTLTLGTIGGAPAGLYSDELTIEISTL